MTMGISRIFRSTDVGAPVFTNNVVGSLTALLKAILVNGYGSTASLGWTLEFDGTNVSAFRMKGGTRTFIRLDDSSYNSVMHAEISAFSTMSSLNNGTERIPSVGVPAYIQKGQAAYGACPWIAVGDDAGIYVFINSLYPYGGIWVNGYYTAFYLGDYNVWDIKNKYNFCLCAMNAVNPPVASNISSCFFIHGPADGNKKWAARGCSLTKGCVNIGLLPFNNNTYFGQNLLSSLSLNSNTKLNGVNICSPIHLYELSSLAVHIVLGSLPGIFEPVGYDIGGSNTATAVATQKIETVDADGSLSIFMYLINNQSQNLNTTNKIILKVGKGFRNVQ